MLTDRAKIPTDECKYKILARCKSLSVSDVVMVGLSPNLWARSRSLFVLSIIRTATMDRYAVVEIMI